MHEIDNPYAAPNSKPQEIKVAVSNGVVRKLFSPNQGAIGAFLLGPLTGLFILQANFAALDEPARRGKTLVYGMLASLAVATLSPFIPENIPAVMFGLLYMFPTRYVMEKFHPSKQQIIDSPNFEFRSNWLVLGIGLLGITVYMIVIIAVLLTYMLLGWVPKLW